MPAFCGSDHPSAVSRLHPRGDHQLLHLGRQRTAPRLPPPKPRQCVPARHDGGHGRDDDRDDRARRDYRQIVLLVS